MVGKLASDEVIDTIASIEVRRQEMAKESGLEGSRSLALRRLQEALDIEQRALQQLGPSPDRLANRAALASEIQRDQALHVSGQMRSGQRGGRPRQSKRHERRRSRR